MAQYPDLDGKVAAITGGARGIGEAMVRAFHQQGARVWFCDCDASAGKRLLAELGANAFFHPADLRRPRQAQAWIARILRRAGRIDVLVNNAAADPRWPLEKMRPADWDDLFARNLRPYFLTAQAAAPSMPPGGAIINLGSITFHLGPKAMTAYVATKAGILGFTRALARELGPRRIRVNTLAPGWVMTERQLRMFVTPAVKRLVRRSQCIPDLIQPEEIAEAALFLASDASRSITGQEILADRGWCHS